MNTKIISGLFVASLSIGSLGCGMFSKAGDTEPVSGATEVGTPVGEKLTRGVGPEGGTIVSPDGRMTLTVPPNAVSGPTEFSIQPITNLARGGMGNAYRLEPSGQNFTAPIRVSFNFDTPDLKDLAPEGLAVGYQDKTGVWQSFDTIDIDTTRKWVTVSAEHFTDLSVWTHRLSPETATLHVGENLSIGLIGCIDQLNALTKIRKFFGGSTCQDITALDGKWSVDIGTITPAGPGGAVYQAPGKKPFKNVATVTYEYKLWASGEANIKDVRTAKITILSRGWTATGSDGPTSYSGTICSLDKQFTVIARTGPIAHTVKFTPIGEGRTGNATSIGKFGSLSFNGSGPYTVEGFDDDNPTIIFNVDTILTSPGGASSGIGDAHIVLVPLETEGCN